MGLTHPSVVPLLGVEGAEWLTAGEAEARGFKGKSEPVNRSGDGMVTKSPNLTQ